MGCNRRHIASHETHETVRRGVSPNVTCVFPPLKGGILCDGYAGLVPMAPFSIGGGVGGVASPVALCGVLS